MGKGAPMATSKGNPARWATPDFPTNKGYHYDREFEWIDGSEANLPEKVQTIESDEEFNSSVNEVAKIRTEIQVATQRCHAAYFENLDILLTNIGKMKRERGVMWCGFGVYGRSDPKQKGTMPSYPQVLLERRKGTLVALYAWLEGTPIQESGTDISLPEEKIRWIYTALGDPNDLKRWLVGHLCRALKLAILRPWLAGPEEDLRDYSLDKVIHASIGDLSDDESVLAALEKDLDLTPDAQRIREWMPHPEEEGWGREMDELCHFRFDRWIDNVISAVGQMRIDGKHAPPEPEISVQGWCDRIRRCVRAINAWIDTQPIENALVSRGASKLVVERVYNLLGGPSPEKVWLAASLSKTIRSIWPFLSVCDEEPPQSFHRTAGRANVARGPMREVTAVLAGFQTAWEAQDVDKVMAAYSDEYSDSSGADKSSVRAFYSGLVAQGKLQETAMDLKRCGIAVDGDSATAAPVIYSSAAAKTWSRYTLEKEADGVWRIVNSEQTYVIPEGSP